MRAGIAACQPKKWLDLFGFDLASLLPVQMHCGLTDPPNAAVESVESRSTPDIAVNFPLRMAFIIRTFGLLESSWQLHRLGWPAGAVSESDSGQGLVRQPGKWLTPYACQQFLRCFDVSQEPALRQSARQLRDHELFGRNSLPVPSCS